jgi:hypothetical protein
MGELGPKGLRRQSVRPDHTLESLPVSKLASRATPTEGELVRPQGRPLVSVLLPVYNGKPYLDAALQSILSQTYQRFEVIAIDDGSTDGSYEIIQTFADSRIHLFRQSNQGLPAALNRAIELSKGEYLARQDQDDLALPQRFERQVAFLDAHPSHAMVGTWAEIWVGNDDSGRRHQHPTEDHILRWELLFNNPFVHSSVMLRKSAVQQVGGYCTDTNRQPPEDYELWSRLIRTFEVANIPECLQIYREVQRSMSRTGENPFLTRLIRISAENLAWASGKAEPDDSFFAIAALANGAAERVGPQFRVRLATRALKGAAHRLAGTSHSQQSQLRTRADERLRAVRHAYYASHPSAAHLGLNLAHGLASRVRRKLTRA